MTDSKLKEALDKLIHHEVNGSEPEEHDDEGHDENYVSPMSVPVKYEKQKSMVEGDSDLVTDYKHVRDTIYGLLDKGSRALEHAFKVAVDTEHPRSLEVANQLMKNVGDLADRLTKIHDMIDKRKPSGNGEQGGDEIPNPSTGNTIVVADTSALANVLNQLNSKNKYTEGEFTEVETDDPESTE